MNMTDVLLMKNGYMKPLNQSKMRNEKPKDEATYLYYRIKATVNRSDFSGINDPEFIKSLAWEAVDIMMGQLDPDEMIYWMKVKKKIQKL